METILPSFIATLLNRSDASRLRFIVLALLISVAYQESFGQIEAAGFDDLSEDQKEAAMALLKQAMSETSADPLEIIKQGIEKVKEEEKRKAEFSTLNTFDDSATKENTNEATTLSESAKSMMPEQEAATSSTLAEPDATLSTSIEATTYPQPILGSPALIEPEHEETIDEPAQVQPDLEVDRPEELVPSSTKDELTLTKNELTSVQPMLDPSSSTLHPETPINDSSGEELDQAASDNTEVPPELLIQDDQNNKDYPAQEYQEKAVKPLAGHDDLTTSNQKLPIDEDFEDSYIDRSDPQNPKKVQIKKRKKSRIGSNGASHEQLESKIITSVGDNPNAYSRHSSSSSYSSSSTTNGNRPNKNWIFDQMPRLPTMPSMPSLPPIPPMPPMPPMPVMPFGMPIASAWPNYYGQVSEDYNDFAQPGVYAAAMAGLPGTYYGYPTANEGYISKRQAKKQRRAARRAAREYNY